MIPSFWWFHLFPFFRSCVELIICEQMNKYKVRLKDICTLEFAENKAKRRLTLIRRSMVRSTAIDCFQSTLAVTEASPGLEGPRFFLCSTVL